MIDEKKLKRWLRAQRAWKNKEARRMDRAGERETAVQLRIAGKQLQTVLDVLQSKQYMSEGL